MNYSNKLKELEAKHQALSLEIEALKGMQPEPSEFPQIGDTYWFVERGEVNGLLFDNDCTDRELTSVGNFYQLKEQAEAELETRKVIAELKKCKGVKKFVDGTQNWGLSCHLPTSKISLDWWYESPHSCTQVYFESQKAVESAIEQVGKGRVIKAIKWLACGEY